MKTLFDRSIHLSLLPSVALLVVIPMTIMLAPDFASAQAVPAYLDRVTQIIDDFYANGMPDAKDVISYDAQDRPLSQVWTQTARPKFR